MLNWLLSLPSEIKLISDPCSSKNFGHIALSFLPAYILFNKVFAVKQELIDVLNNYRVGRAAKR